MKTRIETATAPSHWASFLINGDASGISTEERDAALNWLARMDLGNPVSCEDSGFRNFHDALTECPLAADCQTYSFLVPAIQFRTLAIGATFDFVNDSNHMLNSFYDRCEKTSERKYRSVDSGHEFRVGSIDCVVYHVKNAPDAARGAPMGKPNRGTVASVGKWTLQRVRLNSGGYDSSGAYWGIGPALYWAASPDSSVDRYFRAASRDAARGIVRAEFPDAKFFR